MCKPNIVLCKPQSAVCNFSAPYANTQFSAIPTCFAKPSGDSSYFHVLITCSTFPVQPGEVTFWPNFGVRKSLLALSHFLRVCPPM
jgi:hypothetical protein